MATKYTAVYDFDGTTTQQGLTLTIGDTVEVTQQEPNGWWKGKSAANGSSGWFPASYVEPAAIEPLAPPPMAPPPSAPPPSAPPPLSTPAALEAPAAPADPKAAAAPPKPAVAPPPKPTAAPPKKPGGPPPTAPKERVSYYEEVGPAQVIPEAGGQGKGFCDNFWNDKGGQTGFDVLVLKHRNGKEIFKEMSEFFKQRASVEADYAKALLKLSKHQDKYTDAGRTRLAWKCVREELQNSCELHQHFASTLVNNFEKRLMEFKDAQKGNRKAYEQSISSKRKILVATVPNVEKLHDTYSNLAIEVKKLKDAKNRGQQHDQTKRDFNKIVEGLDTKLPLRDRAGDAFKKSLEEYNTVQLDWINEMLLACKEFEDAERDRINFLKDIMTEFSTEGRKVCDGRTECFNKIAAGYASVDAMEDIYAWTSSAATGKDRPRPFPYMTPALIEEGYDRQQAELAARGKK